MIGCDCPNPWEHDEPTQRIDRVALRELLDRDKAIGEWEAAEPTQVRKAAA